MGTVTERRLVLQACCAAGQTCLAGKCTAATPAAGPRLPISSARMCGPTVSARDRTHAVHAEHYTLADALTHGYSLPPMAAAVLAVPRHGPGAFPMLA